VRISRPRLLLWLPALLLALGLSACAERGRVSEAHDEGLYLAAGPLTYQVQISRELNPADVEDRAYLQGLPANVPPPGPGEEYFGVWLRVQNESKQPARSADQFRIIDTLGTKYTPIKLPATNQLSYQPKTLEPAALEPTANSIAQDGPTQGALVLFKVNSSVYQNRPLRFEILDPASPDQVQSTVNLDL
jgi:hypothetical protein